MFIDHARFFIISNNAFCIAMVVAGSGGGVVTADDDFINEGIASCMLVGASAGIPGIPG
jgi:hypothetical protein